MSAHEHAWTEVDRDDNANRTRTKETCKCGAVRYGCFAKQLGEPGTAQTEGFPVINGEVCGGWGPVGRWTYDVVEAP
jgi:hypothetical protein